MLHLFSCCHIFIRETLSGGTRDVKMEFLCIADGGCSHCALVQAAAIHFEKIARREIGAFTTLKNKSRSKLMTPPTSGKEPEESYSRLPISYSILDSIGHCFQVNWILKSTHLSLFPITLRRYSTMHSPFSIAWSQCDVQYG